MRAIWQTITNIASWYLLIAFNEAAGNLHFSQADQLFKQNTSNDILNLRIDVNIYHSDPNARWFSVFTASYITVNEYPPKNDINSQLKRQTGVVRRWKHSVPVMKMQTFGFLSYWCASCSHPRRCLQSRLALTPCDTSTRNASAGCSASFLHWAALYASAAENNWWRFIYLFF